MERGIYLEGKPVSGTDYWHSYLVYRDGQGNERVIRGGPEGGFWDSLWGGDIEVEADVPLSESKDAYRENEKPEDRQRQKIDLQGRDPKEVWKEMVKTARELDAMGLEYDTFRRPQNSNSITRAILERSKIDLKKAGLFLPPDIFKGIGNDLSNPVIDNHPIRKKPDGKDWHLKGTSRDKSSRSEQTPDAPRAAALNPAGRALHERMTELGETPAEIMAKPVDQLTQRDVNRLMADDRYWSSAKSGARAMPELARKYYERQAGRGDGAAPGPERPVSAPLPGGGTMNDGLARLSHVMGQAAEAAGGNIVGPVRNLQETLNSQSTGRFHPPLKVDGAFGPKTNERLRDLVVEDGIAPILSAFERTNSSSF